ncbi:disease resistance protein RPS2 [Cinnamomum micranthum f. kanehirae]|uniref:Disease resistance protein RPS2 n=1 Tax=Cinnamomum micranthum f. kanehirae TaxID=337451 RepID=A0A3S3N4X4_9MAGN|nr:disease resistance protein RPS2 [Cinnamomum micranthum f. kanehirae]
MEIIASIIQIIPNLCTEISHQTDYVRHLENSVGALMVEAGKLKALCEDTEREGREASRRRKRLTNQAQTWLDQALPILDEIDFIKLQFDQRRSFCNGCLPDLWSDYKLGKRAFEKLECVLRELNERGGIKLVAMSSPPRVMADMDVPMVGQSSAQRTMEKIWNLLHDEHTSVVYVYGMGGVGKTTLMKAINKKFVATSDFDYVIWATVSNVSRELNSERVQQEIMGRLQLNFSENDSYSIRSMQLRQFLTEKRYMLILDDLWKPINLGDIGIPTNKENRSKIAITTRIAHMSAVQVCSDNCDMKAEKVRVETLTEDEAWELFAAKVGKEVVSQPHIKDVAKDVAKKCGGLPLAIVAVAKAMEGQYMRELWQDALRALRASAPEIEGMEPQVFLPLKLSYDDLKR